MAGQRTIAGTRKKPRAGKPQKGRKAASKKELLDHEQVPDLDFGGIPERNLKKNLGC